ncbi:Cas10/Cmr2 second palm domain-containing protein [Thermodesulfovibrio sp.]|uniref:Cas10/Cmr2 second palm domain-containing protein n=1 Tax=Thermodesulfovibrio sp. TaxID=2067987 RepID=UPI003C7BA29D
MEDKFFAVLLDTVSIQRYVFSTNNLKENIGASYIVEDIYDSHLKKVNKEMFPELTEEYYEAWETEPDRIRIKENGVPFEIGYIGGGNALLLFKEKDRAQEFIKKWTLRLLIHAPGIIPACAFGEIDLNNFSSSLKILFKTLAKNKASFVPQTIIRRHGITAECPRTGLSREVWCRNLPDEEQDYISSVSNAKIEAAEKAKRKIIEILKELNLDKKYTFTDELDKLGQSKGEDSHIAIVHIDGNDMGQRVKEQKDLVTLRKFSCSVRRATLDSFKGILKELDKYIDYIEEAKKYQEQKKELKLVYDGGKTILPIRPIIIGGDDITFVSEGRLGIWLAKVFLEEFERQKVSDGKPLTACAGIAITKTKYPFYRGYELSENLCKSAKRKRKEQRDNGSWLDFHLAYGGFSGSLDDIRESHYKAPNVKSLVLRPYKIQDFYELLSAVSEFKKKDNGKTKFPRSKLMELRQVLYMDKDAQELFIEELSARQLKLPKYKDFDGSEIVKGNQTPYFDMIELIELYPESALNGGSR